jgi:hypothetical protein
MPTLIEIVSGITPIIDTVRAGTLASGRMAVRNAYEPNATRYFPSGAMDSLRKNMTERVGRGDRCLGYLQAPYGHGKTAAAIYLWSACEKAGALAVPPFQFTSLDDVVTGVGGYLTEALRDKNAQLAKEAEELGLRYRTDAVDRVAEAIAREHRIALETARAIAEKEIATRNSVGQAAHLADYLVACSHLAVKAGYKSLCVFLDEMQLFIDSGDTREKVENFRQLILALRGESNAPLGLIFIVHERVGMVLEEQAGDAMQRLRDENAGLNLGQFKETTFPSRLLDHLCKLAGEKCSDIIEDAVLEALGQITVRDDLSNGPRTVAAALRAVGRHRAQTGKKYTVWDLARDYENREIVFDGVERSLAGALAKLLSDEVVRSNKEFGNVVRYLAMFPEGVAENLLKRAGLLNSLTELAQERGLLGTVIYAPRAEHWALKVLQQNPGNEDRVTSIVRLFRDNFWYRQTEAARLGFARHAFARILLPEVFPKRGQGDMARKFSGHPAAGSFPDRTPSEILLTGSYEGTAAQYPERSVALAIASDKNELNAYRPSNDDTHLYFTFQLIADLPEEAKGSVETAHSDPRIAFVLNLNRSIGNDYPPELNLLRDSIVPRQCNALILLNLLFYIEEFVPRLSLPESDRAQIREYLTKNARRVTIQLLFDAEHLEAVGTTAMAGRGAPLLEKLFAAKLAERFPKYHVLQAGAESLADLERYERLLRDGGFSLPVKRGQKPVRLTTKEFLARMGASAGSAFDAVVSRLKRLQLLVTSGEASENGLRSVDFTLREHPLETLLYAEVERDGVETIVRRGGRDLTTHRLDRPALLRLARRNGYGTNEFELALKLASWRQRLESDSNDILITVAADDPDALAREAEEVAKRIEELAKLDPTVVDLAERCRVLANGIPTADEDTLSEIALELRLLSEAIKTRVESAISTQRTEIERLYGSIADFIRALPLTEASKVITLPGAIGGVLENARKRLERSLINTKAEWEHLGAQLRGISESMTTDTPTTALTNTITRRGKIAGIAGVLRQAPDTVRLVNSYLTALSHWRSLAATAERLEFVLAEQSEELARTLADWVDSVVTAARDAGSDFATFLARHNDFKPSLDAIETQSRGMEQQKRDRYDAFVRQLSELFSGAELPTTRAVPFDPRSEEHSYQALADDASGTLKTAVNKMIASLTEMQARATFLREFRERDVSKLLASLDTERATLLNISREIDADIVLLYRGGKGKLPAYCGQYQSALVVRSTTNKELSALEKPDPTNGALQDEVILSLRSADGSSHGLALSQLFSALRKKRSATANDLFKALEELYTQGNVELVIRERHK